MEWASVQSLTDASNKVISITGTVGTYTGNSFDPGAISGPVSPPNVVLTGGGSNIFGMDGMLNPSAPYFGTGIGFTLVNPPVGVQGARWGYALTSLIVVRAKGL